MRLFTLNWEALIKIEPGTQLERLTENIRNELGASNAILELGLENSQLDELAERIAWYIDYAFDYRFVAKWVKPGEPHAWKEDADDSITGEWHFRECLACGRMTKHPTDAEAEADYRQHFTETHGS